VYRSAKGGRLGVVVANYDEKDTASITIGTPEGGLEKWRLIDDPQWRAFTGSVELPPLSCAVIV
jgi:hypothetical protein